MFFAFHLFLLRHHVGEHLYTIRISSGFSPGFRPLFSFGLILFYDHYYCSSYFSLSLFLPFFSFGIALYSLFIFLSSWIGADGME